MISEAEVTGNPNDAEDEAEASVYTFETNIKSIKWLPMHNGSSLAKKSYHITVQILFWTAVISNTTEKIEIIFSATHI